MQKIIWEALQEAEKLLNRQIPFRKLEGKQRSVEGMTISEIAEAYPDIPNTAVLSSDDNGSVLLCWNISVNVTGEDILQFKRKRFPSIAWQCVYNALKAAGYTRIGFCSNLLKPFDGISIYDVYLSDNKDFFVEYYSFRFKKEPKL